MINLLNLSTLLLSINADVAQSSPGEASHSAFLTFENHYWELLSSGVFSVVFYVVLMVLLLFLFYKKEKALDFCDRYLTHSFIAVWIMGFIIYNIGMYPDHCHTGFGAFWTMLGVAPMAIIHAFEMFILQSDAAAIHEGCHSSGWYMFFFSIVHILAAFISMVFVIKHFGFNIISSFIRFWKTNIWTSNVKNLYIFWGMNDATYYLAKDIFRTKHDSDARILIVRVNNGNEETNKLIGMDRLFSFLSLSSNNLENLQELQKLGCLTNSTFGSLINPQKSGDDDLLRHELRLTSIIKMLRHTTESVHMFFLENDDVFNIQAIANLKKDKNLISFANHGKIKFYCHARYNSIHRVIEDESSHKNMEVRVVDSSHISVELLKQDVALQPVSYVDINDDATVSSPFNALVVGFSEVGWDTVRFLYEFGAFVKQGSTTERAFRSDFHCDVVDKIMSARSGLFVANAPAIDPKLNPKDEQEASQSMICLYDMDCQSVEFYKSLEERWLPRLNYVVLATGDDEMNVSHAVRIFRMAVRYRKDLKQFRIMVRVQHDEKGHLRKIAQHYNRLWAAEGNSTNDTMHLHQGVIKATEQFDTPITLFGSSEGIYTYDHIINETLKEKAKSFKLKYDLSYNEVKKASNQNIDPIVSWDDEQNEMMQLTGNYVGFSPTFSGIMRLRRTQSQNIANSLHAATKMKLALTALGQEGYEIIQQHGLIRQNGKTDYIWRDGADLPIERIQRVMDVLAQTEHLRWNASHEILGYRNQGDINHKDESKMQHGCLKEWHELQTDIKSYDYNIVDVSLNVYGIDMDEK